MLMPFPARIDGSEAESHPIRPIGKQSSSILRPLGKSTNHVTIIRLFSGKIKEKRLAGRHELLSAGKRAPPAARDFFANLIVFQQKFKKNAVASPFFL